MGSNTPVRADPPPVEVSPENPSVCRSALVTEKKNPGNSWIVWVVILLPKSSSVFLRVFFSLRCINKEERVSATRREDGDLTLLQSSSVCVSPSPADSQ